jgi:DNA-binding NarL/FixJ family response regulator
MIRSNDYHSVHLAPREIQILELISQGLANKQIAARLGMREDTVKTRNYILMEKLGAVNRTDAVMKAFALGILAPVQK